MTQPPRVLMTRSETLEALEHLAASAERELIMAFRSFSPQTALRTERLRELGLSTWSDLIPWLTRRGVQLFLAFGDDDPVLDPDRHRRAWLTASGFANVAQGDAQIICAPHGQKAGALWRWRLSRPLRRALAQLRDEDPRRLTLPQRAALQGSPAIRSQHVDHAFAVADGAQAVIGGFTLDARRQETLWHDVALAVDDSDFAGALRAHFADCWADAIATGAPTLATPPRPFHSVTRRQSRPELRLLRTLSAPRSGVSALTGTPRDGSFANQLIKHLEAAKHSIYIETAALRHRPVAEALKRATAASPELQLVLILHPGGDRLPLGGALRDTGPQSETLQAHLLHQLSHAFGKRAALLHLPFKAPALPGGVAPLPGRLTVIDQTYSVIGSPDLTPRAASLDSHAAVLVRDETLATDILHRRAALWGATSDMTAADWTALAASDASPLDPVTTEPARPRPGRLPEALL